MLSDERTTHEELPAPREVEGLVVAPGRTVMRSLVGFLRGEGINVRTVADAEGAFEEALLHPPDIVLIDDRVPPSGGIDLVPYPVLIAAAGLAGAALAAVVGLATLRVSGIYFVIFSLGLAELVRQVMTWLQHVLGTMSGLYVTIDRDEAEYYWQLLSLTAAVFLVGWWIGRSRLGFALRIIGNDEVVAVHCGINTARAKVILFVISSMFAAVAGALVAPRWSYVEPVVAFSPFVSFQVVIMALLGGTHRLWGPLVGVIPFVLI